MTLGDILALIEILLLVWILVQGEKVCYYERGVYRIQSEREKERREWRDAKKRQALKKLETVVVADTINKDPQITPMVGERKE